MRVDSVSVLCFSDYRLFLLAHAKQKKATQPRWSLGSWSKHLGLEAPSSLTKILRGRRHPGPKIVGKLIAYFDFNKEEERYFRELVQVQKLHRAPELTSLLLEDLAEKKSCPAKDIIDEVTFSEIADWYYFAIREMVNLDDFVEDPIWISRRLGFRVPPAEVQKVISKMLRLGLLERQSTGSLRVRLCNVDTKSDVASEGVKRYHEQSLENAKAAIRKFGTTQREYTSTACVIDTEKLPAAKEMIRRFRERFVRAFEKERGNEVYQIEISLFPLTKEIGNEKQVSKTSH